MQSKSRKLNKEELELWKFVTKNDKILGNYTESVEKNSIIKKKKSINWKKRKKRNIRYKKRYFWNQKYSN